MFNFVWIDFWKSLRWKISESRFFGLTKDLTFRFQFWNAGIIKIIRAKYQWLQIFQIDYLTFQQFSIWIIGYSMTSLDPVQRFFSISKGILLQLTFVYGQSGWAIWTSPAICIGRCGHKFESFNNRWNRLAPIFGQDRTRIDGTVLFWSIF